MPTICRFTVNEFSMRYALVAFFCTELNEARRTKQLRLQIEVLALIESPVLPGLCRIQAHRNEILRD